MVAPDSPVAPLGPAELDAAIATLTAAFCRDPMYHALIPDENARRPWVEFLMAGLVRAAGPRALLVGVDGGQSGALYATPSDGSSRFAGLLGLLGPLLHLPLDKLEWRRAIAVSRAVDKLLPKEPNLHLHVVAVSDAARGRGLGALLVRHAIEAARGAGRVLHLETTNPENLPFYRKLGLVVRDEVRCFAEAPPLYTLQSPS